MARTRQFQSHGRLIKSASSVSIATTLHRFVVIMLLYAVLMTGFETVQAFDEELPSEGLSADSGDGLVDELVDISKTDESMLKAPAALPIRKETDTKRTQRNLSAPGSKPPLCTSKCGKCMPCTPIRVPVQPGTRRTSEYYPEAWRCKCGGKLYMP